MKWSWLIYALIVTPLLALAGIVWMTYGIFGEHPVRDLTTVSKWTRLHFPSCTKIIDGAAQGPNAFSVVAQIQMPQAHVQEFLSQPRSKEAEVSRQRFTTDYGGAGN